MKKKIIIISISTAVILLAAGGGFFAYEQHNKNLREEVINTFITSFEKKDFKKLSETLSETAIKEQELDKTQLISKYDSIFTGLGITDIKGKLTNMDKESFTFTLSMTTPFGKLENKEYQGTLTKDDGYQINWDYSLIFPEMKKGDKVYMSNEAPTRGNILDANNTPLATTHEYPQYGTVPNQLGTDDEKVKNIEAISQAFEMTTEEVNSLLTQEWVQEDSFVPIKTVDFNASQDKYELTGVQAQSVTKRYYPLNEAAAQLVGYTGTVTAEEIEKDGSLTGFNETGKTGLEAQLDEELRGKQGGKIEITNENNEVQSVLVEQEKEDGKNIQLTIDSNLQKQAFAALGNKAGSTVVTEPTNGQLKAVVSSPSYNPNEFILGMSQEKYDSYANDPLNPFSARFGVGYAPGSTFKTITAAIGIDNQITSPDKTHEISGLKWQKDSSWGNYFVTRVSDVASVNMNDALIYSDNIYFAQEALEMGQEKYVAGLEKFPFDEKMNVNIVMTPAQISNEGITSDILLADTSYGQGQLLINPIQQAVMYSAFANNGNIVLPQIIVGSESKTMENVVSENAANTVKSALIQVVEDSNGTAHNLSLGNQRIAAKTGTAEIKEKQDTKGKENSFVLAFDAVNSHYLVASMLEDATDTSAVKQNQEFIQALLGE